MRRLLLAPLLTLLLVAPAGASDHLMQTVEVRPDAADRFVELRDSVAEPFPNPIYSLASYGPSGEELGYQQFNDPQPFQGSTSPFTVAATGGDAALTINLATSGSVCFHRGLGTDGPKIHCLAYGAVPAGQSAQLQSCGKVAFAAATKDATNAVVPSACSGGGGGGPGGGPGGGGSDSTKPVAKLGGKRSQKLSKLSLTVSVDEASTVVVTGSAKARGKKRKAKRATRKLSKAGKATIKVRFSKKNRRVLKKALAAGGKPVVKLKATVTDRAGNPTVKRRSISLKR